MTATKTKIGQAGTGSDGSCETCEYCGVIPPRRAEVRARRTCCGPVRGLCRPCSRKQGMCIQCGADKQYYEIVEEI